MQWKTRGWEEIDRSGLYALLQLRAEVFVVEQDCAYQDLDGKDEAAVHVVATEAGECVATARILPPGLSYPEPSIGRVVVAAAHRGTGLGRQLMGRALAACLDRWPDEGVRISAQSYLTTFYASLGFAPSSEPYLEDGLPHIQMFRPALPQGAWKPFEALPRDLDAWEMALDRLPLDRILGAGEAGWHAGQITDHLSAAESATWHYILRKTSGSAADALPLDASSDARARALSARLRSTERFAMPEGLSQPAAPESVSALQALHSHRRSLASAGRAHAASLPPDWWAVQVFKHPLAGRIGLSDAARFLADHMHHHHHQLLRLVGEE